MFRGICFCFLFLITSIACAVPNYDISIAGQQAKDIYLFLTGPHVDAQGAAGHLYRRGTNIVCKYVNADMDDAKGRSIPRQDVRRYSCEMTIDRNGDIAKSNPV